jgi:glyoxylase-like metal-dependent hydrolase (beta-lactamase superfamily II)
MDCCGHEGPGGDARFDFRRVADGIHVAVAAPAEIQLLYLGRAHTEGDVFVYLPSEKVVITGDAVIGWMPFMGDGYPED